MTKKHNHVRATWLGEHRFEAGRTGGVTHSIDASTKEGPSTGDTLLKALAADCILSQRLGQNLQGNFAFEPRVSCPIDLTHPAGANRTQDFVWAEFFAHS